MKTCPIDNAQLMEINKSGVMIDVCPECKGVWLDRGELEKIVAVTKELEAEFGDSPRDARRIETREPSRDRDDERYRNDSRDDRYSNDSRDDRYRRRDDDDDDRSKRGKRGGLGRLFDIFD